MLEILRAATEPYIPGSRLRCIPMHGNKQLSVLPDDDPQLTAARESILCWAYAECKDFYRLWDGISIRTLIAWLGSYETAQLFVGLCKILNLGEIAHESPIWEAGEFKFNYTDHERLAARIRHDQAEADKSQKIPIIRVGDDADAQAKMICGTHASAVQDAGVTPELLKAIARCAQDVGSEEDIALVTRVGNALNDAGGFELMSVAAHYVREHAPNPLAMRTVEILWDGIGEWQG